MSISSRIARPTVADRESLGHPSALIVRAIFILLLLLVAIAAATVFLLALGLLPASSVVAVFAPLGDVLGAIAGSTFSDRALAAGAAAVVGVAALVLMARAPRELPQAPAKHILQADEKGLVVIAARSVETVAVQTVLRQPGVVDARVRVKGRPSGPVRLRIEVDVLPGADVKRLGSRIQDAGRTCVEDLVGLTVRDANVEVRVLDPEDLAEVMG